MWHNQEEESKKNPYLMYTIWIHTFLSCNRNYHNIHNENSVCLCSFLLSPYYNSNFILHTHNIIPHICKSLMRILHQFIQSEFVIIFRQAAIYIEWMPQNKTVFICLSKREKKVWLIEFFVWDDDIYTNTSNTINNNDK